MKLLKLLSEITEEQVIKKVQDVYMFLQKGTVNVVIPTGGQYGDVKMAKVKYSLPDLDEVSIKLSPKNKIGRAHV